MVIPKKSLTAAEPAVRRNQGLIRLKTAGLPVNFDQLALGACDAERLKQLYSSWGFKGMLAQLQAATLPQEIQEALL